MAFRYLGTSSASLAGYCPLSLKKCSSPAASMDRLLRESSIRSRTRLRSTWARRSTSSWSCRLTMSSKLMTLLSRARERCRRAKKLDSVIIATDDLRIANAAFDWGAEVALTSPRHQSGTDRVAEVAKKGKEFGYVVNIQGDEPLVDPCLIDRLIEKLRSDRKIDIVTSSHLFEDAAEASSPHQVKVVLDLKGRALYFSRTAIPYPHNVSQIKYLRHQGI